MSLRHLRAIVRKEINHILRDRMTFVLVMLTPLAMLFIFAYALTVDIKNVPIAVLDYDRTSTSRSFVQRVTEGDDLELYTYVDRHSEIESLLTWGEIKAALVIGTGSGAASISEAIIISMLSSSTVSTCSPLISRLPSSSAMVVTEVSGATSTMNSVPLTPACAVGVLTVKTDFPDIKLDLVHDLQTGLRKVALGISDALVATLPVALYYIEKEGNEIFKTLYGVDNFFTKLAKELNLYVPR